MRTPPRKRLAVRPDHVLAPLSCDECDRHELAALPLTVRCPLSLSSSLLYRGLRPVCLEKGTGVRSSRNRTFVQLPSAGLKSERDLPI